MGKKKRARGHCARFLMHSRLRRKWALDRMKLIMKKGSKYEGKYNCLVAVKPKGRANPGESLNLDERSDGYWTTRISLTDEAKVECDGKLVFKRDSLYLHHLGALIGKPKEQIEQWLQQGDELDLDFSHLCHNPACFKPCHVHVEPHPTNKSRHYCKTGAQKCAHDPPCLL